MKKLDGFRYKLENSASGQFSPDSDSDPTITVLFGAARIRYKLAAYATGENVGGEMIVGKLDDEDMEKIFDWMDDHINELLYQSNVQHRIRFVKGSDCYYDFFNHSLYNSSYGRENNEEPVHLSETFQNFINKLTGLPEKDFSSEYFIGKREGITTARSFSTTWGSFRKLDPDIAETFNTTGKSKVRYTGLPQVWEIIEVSSAVTLKTIFDAVSYLDVTAVSSGGGKQFTACVKDECSQETIIRFLGLSSDVFDISQIDADRFVRDNFISSKDHCAQLLYKYCLMINSLWEHIYRKIKDNLILSIKASSFFNDTNDTAVPQTFKELETYNASEKRMYFTMEKHNVYDRIKSLINDTRAGTDFFEGCVVDCTKKDAIDYITALVLICFNYCKPADDDSDIGELRAFYSSSLKAQIQKRFDYVSPGTAAASFAEELRKQTLKLIEPEMSDMLNVLENKDVKEYNTQNLSPDDDNSLTRPSPVL